MAHKRQFIAIGKRIKLVRGNQSQSLFASKTKTIKQTVSKYEKGKILPGCEFLYMLHTRKYININWLMSGEGGIYKYPESIMERFKVWCNNNMKCLPSEEDVYIYGMFVERLGMDRTKAILKNK